MGDAASHPPTLSYVTPPRGGSSWVIVILCVYLSLMLALVAGALVTIIGGSNWSGGALFGGTLLVLLVCEAGLLFVPVRRMRGRPVSRRSLWFPLIASGLLAALLVLGAGLALVEFFKSEKYVLGAWIALGVAIAAWVIWAVVFYVIARRTSPQGVGARLHRYLLVGSVLELLVAVPTHLVVRRRTECCAGIYTGFGIACGVGIMLLAFGPSVFLLYLRRWKDIQLPDVRET